MIGLIYRYLKDQESFYIATQSREARAYKDGLKDL